VFMAQDQQVGSAARDAVNDEIRWFRPEEVPPLAHEPVGPAVVEAMRRAHA
jgi:hypothetical protein